jgi:hypothetical protein
VGVQVVVRVVVARDAARALAVVVVAVAQGAVA